MSYNSNDYDDGEPINAQPGVPNDVQLKRALGIQQYNESAIPPTQSYDGFTPRSTTSQLAISMPSPDGPDSATHLLADGEVLNADESSLPTTQLVRYGDVPIIKCVNLHKSYLMGFDAVPALRGIQLSIYKGEFCAILGKSGGGKTSLLNILGTIDKPSKGELFLAGKRITSATTDDEFARIRLQNIGFVFQQFNLISTMTAKENVSLPMTLFGKLSRSEISDRAQALLDMVGIGPRSHHLPSQLSGGEQQRVTIARAIANRPDVLLLDEPTGDLDTKNSHLIMDMLVKLNRQEGITLVMVTHDTDLVDFAHRVIHVVDGKIMKINEVAEETRKRKEAALALQIIQDREDRRIIIEQTQGITEVRESPLYYKQLQPKSA